MSRKLLVIALFAAALILAACGGATTAAPTAAPTGAPTAAQAQPTAAPAGPTTAPVPAEAPLQIPYVDLWKGSAHADATAEAFTHWDTADPKAVPVGCARCHSGTGFQDFIGADGSKAGVVDVAQPIGNLINCVACHNDAASKLTSVTFPSGVTVDGLGGEARCMTCHQGRASELTVTDVISKSGVTNDDTVSDKITFSNVHYLAAGATLYGGVAQGGFQYPGHDYDRKNLHVDGYDNCIQCHDQHSLKVRITECATCHQGVSTEEDLKKIRMRGSLRDYNGNGDITEGIAPEIDGVRAVLLTAIQAYAKDVAKVQIAYTGDANPYFFIDTNGNGTAEKDEAVSANKYVAWTARLAKAAYNYQFSIKDPGAFAHNPKYVIELLYDSIENLNEGMPNKVDTSKLVRGDAGHFNGGAAPFRDWDETGVVPGSCAKCHTPGGVPQFLAEGVTISAPAANGLMCKTCHDAVPGFTLRQTAPVTFPSGAKLDLKDPGSNLCITCHQGRESTVSVNNAIKGLEPDTPSDKLKFRNVHYFAAGATLFGGDAKGAYQYDGKDYIGQNTEHPLNVCTACHDAHQLLPDPAKCAGCHQGVKTLEDLGTIRMPTDAVDYNGNGDTKEGIKAEIDGVRAVLYTALQAYSKDVAGSQIAYSPDAYPYFFNDKNGNGTVDPDEAKSDNAYNKWTPRLLQAAYNYQYSIKDPGAFTHNPKYIVQVLFDSIESLSAKTTVDMSKLVRPEAPKP